MQGISLSTALTIVANPYDLKIIVYQGPTSGKFGYVIRRGPKHNFTLLVEVGFIYASRAYAAAAVRKLLLTLEAVVVSELANPTSPVAQTLSPDEGSLQYARIFSTGLAERIESELRQDTVVCTWQMIAA